MRRSDETTHEELATAMSLCVAVTALFLTAPTVAQLRVVNYNVAHLNGDTAALDGVMLAAMIDNKPGFVVVPQVFAFQEVHSDDLAPIELILNSVAPEGFEYAHATFTWSPGENSSGGAQALFYRTDAITETPSEHADIYTGAGRNADRWKLNLVGYTGPESSFYLYSMHLRAGTGDANELERLAGVNAVQDDAMTLPRDVHIIFAGDFNFYNNAEPGYIELTAPGPVQAIDPLGTGSWAGIANAIKHSQSPRLVNEGGLAGGGMDDRFDLQLSTAPFHDRIGLSLIAGVYRSLGNDGMHYNVAINEGNNFYWPDDPIASNALADDLYDASDHLPVIVEYQLPISADLNGDGVVGPADLAELLAQWGACPPRTDCAADFDRNGSVGASDLAELLAQWG